MKTIEYINENLAPGNIGYFFVVLSFGAALFSLIAYFFHNRDKRTLTWRNLGRTSFFIHGISVLGIFAVLFYLIKTHQYQYNYVWEHSSDELQPKYIIACFWGGSEGSFLLWAFWQMVLGCVLIFTAKKWEAPVMIIIAMSQTFLASMLLGLHFHIFNQALQIGVSPFELLRQAFAKQGLPLFNDTEMHNALGGLIKSVTKVNGRTIVDYSAALKQVGGQGLNALLQNYWMVIHPPVLFLGFASTIVPFAFAMAGLWNKDYTGWVRPALPWAVFCGMFLGTGILMGGAWAYESLSFGGFWAWDPVENGILVPWLLLVAGLHAMQIYRARKTALLGAIVFVSLTYILILYANFLTRSGVLGDSSVHSFADLGLAGQLLIFMFAFIFLAIITLIVRWRHIPSSPKEENISSREFWMFIGALVLSLSALHIVSITSIPVINKVNGLINDLLHVHLKTNIAPPANPAAAYHVMEIPFAIIVAFLTGIGQYLRYHNTKRKYFLKKILLVAAIAVVPTVLMMIASGLYENWEYILLLYASFFSIVGNIEIFIDMIRKKTSKLSGPSIAHIGFGLILVGALIANAKKETISLNTEGMQVDALAKATAKEQYENKVLFKDFPTKMHGYTVTYKGDSSGGNYLFFRVNYKKTDSTTGNIKEDFDLYPMIIYQKKNDQNMSYAPSSKHYWTKDIFTHVTSAFTGDSKTKIKYDTSYHYEVKEGQSFIADSFTITLMSIIKETTKTTQGDMYRVTMKLKVNDGFSTEYASPALIIKGNQILHDDAEIKDFGLGFRYNTINIADGTHDLIVLKGKRPERQYITLKAIIFPYINFLWLGSVVMFIGFFVALLKRIREYKTA